MTRLNGGVEVRGAHVQSCHPKHQIQFHYPVRQQGTQFELSNRRKLPSRGFGLRLGQIKDPDLYRGTLRCDSIQHSTLTICIPSYLD
jgi:hypothetical protein